MSIHGYLVVVLLVVEDIQGKTTVVDLDEVCIGVLELSHYIFSCPISLIIITVLQNHATIFTYICINHLAMERAYKLRHHKTSSRAFWFKHLSIVP